MNPFISEDWRKQASMTAANDLDIEKAFSDQASGFVENKVGDLMKDEYRIGFEIVKKNDSNTRMVGMFAFKVDKDLIFAPVFFINGEIKGPLLYRAGCKMFVPADKDWAAYLIDSLEHRDGKGRSKSSLDESAPLVQMQRLTFNPSTGMGKRASADVVEDPSIEFEVKKVSDASDKVTGVYVIEKSLNTKPGEQPKLSTGDSILKMASADDGTVRVYLDGSELGMLSKEAAGDIEEGYSTELKFSDCAIKVNSDSTACIKKAFFDNIPDNSEQWNLMLDVVEKQAAASAGLIRKFLEEPGFGKPAAETIVKAASDYNFAEALASNYPAPSDLFPDSYTSLEKQSSATQGALEICFGVDDLEKSASVSKKYFADGFYIKDTRPAETMSVVYETSPGTVSHVSEPGVYSLLKDDGEFEDNVLVLQPGFDRAIGNMSENHDFHCKAIAKGLGNYDRELPEMVAIKDGKMLVSSGLHGVLTDTISSADNSRVSPKNVYIICLDGNALGPVAVYSVATADGVTRAKIRTDKWFHGTGMAHFDDDRYSQIVINPDLDKSNVDAGVFGKDAKFIKLGTHLEHDRSFEDTCVFVSFNKLENIGSKTAVNKWIFNNFNASKVKVERDAYSEKKAYHFTGMDGRRSDAMSRMESMVKLSRDLGISATSSYTILDTADHAGSYEFYVQPMCKSASRLTLIDRPIFDDEFDSEFGLPVQPTKKYNLRVQGEQTMAPASAIGDMMNPTTATGLPDLTVATTAPEDLQALADTYHLPHVFEHGVVGTLANTFNAIAMVEKYTPKLEEGVDALGRTKFLFHWCPDDFERAYGKDDMANLEAEIDTNFEELGALLLKLLRKSERNKRPDVKFENQ